MRHLSKSIGFACLAPKHDTPFEISLWYKVSQTEITGLRASHSNFLVWCGSCLFWKGPPDFPWHSHAVLFTSLPCLYMFHWKESTQEQEKFMFCSLVYPHCLEHYLAIVSAHNFRRLCSFSHTSFKISNWSIETQLKHHLSDFPDTLKQS